MWTQKKKYSYSWIHKWVYANLGKATYCSNDKKHTGKRFEWANISRENKLETSDWKQLCPSCHRKFDYTEETRYKMRLSCLGRTNAKRTPVKQLDLKGNLIATFSMVKEASEKLKISRTGICNCLSGRNKTCGGFEWRLI